MGMKAGSFHYYTYRSTMRCLWGGQSAHEPNGAENPREARKFQPHGAKKNILLIKSGVRAANQGPRIVHRDILKDSKQQNKQKQYLTPKNKLMGTAVPDGRKVHATYKDKQSGAT